jgi:hypothetical protein
MGTRSSRFFVVLLHLVAVSRFRIPTNPRRHPDALVGGASLPGNEYQEPRHSLSLHMDQQQQHSQHTPEPSSFWLQDTLTQDCLGPMGWSDCGDASLWSVVAAPPQIRMGLFGIQHLPSRGHQLCLLEDDRPRHRVCLSVPKDQKQVLLQRRRRRRRRRNQAASLWELDANKGFLQSMAKSSDKELCMSRSNVASESRHMQMTACEEQQVDVRKVPIALIRYQSLTLASEKGLELEAVREERIACDLVPGDGSRVDDPQPLTGVELPSFRVLDAPSSAPSYCFPPLSASSTPALGKPLPKRRQSKTIDPIHVLPYLNREQHGQLQRDILRDSNPILFTSQLQQQMLSSNRNNKQRPNDSNMLRNDKADRIKPHHKMAVHPYLQAAQNEIWKDPSTGLEYATDLTVHLDRNRKDHGRHSLMGVGQYVKGFVIKVYGVAFYVSKRDALADPALEPFAGLTADELRQRPDFYEVLRTMGTTSGTFERTIVLKTNMQLSADTMRSSLHADWSQLTDEMKNTLLDSSMEPRPADDSMIQLVQSPDNPSRCSCSSVAPPEYNANPNCCARGTELAFTWFKTGELEVSRW